MSPRESAGYLAVVMLVALCSFVGGWRLAHHEGAAEAGLPDPQEGACEMRCEVACPHDPVSAHPAARVIDHVCYCPVPWSEP